MHTRLHRPSFYNTEHVYHPRLLPHKNQGFVGRVYVLSLLHILLPLFAFFCTVDISITYVQTVFRSGNVRRLYYHTLKFLQSIQIAIRGVSIPALRELVLHLPRFLVLRVSPGPCGSCDWGAARSGV